MKLTKPKENGPLSGIFLYGNLTLHDRIMLENFRVKERRKKQGMLLFKCTAGWYARNGRGAPNMLWVGDFVSCTSLI